MYLPILFVWWMLNPWCPPACRIILFRFLKPGLKFAFTQRSSVAADIQVSLPPSGAPEVDCLPRQIDSWSNDACRKTFRWAHFPEIHFCTGLDSQANTFRSKVSVRLLFLFPGQDGGEVLRWAVACHIHTTGSAVALTCHLQKRKFARPNQTKPTGPPQVCLLWAGPANPGPSPSPGAV